MANPNQTQPLNPPGNSTARVYLCIGLFLSTVYLCWYTGVWPGPMGQDGYSLIANINQGAPKYTGKDAAWLLYALATYGTTQRIEVLILPLLLLHVAIFTRMTGWLYVRKFQKTAIGLIFAVGCTPHVLNYATSLYPDSIFSLAFIALLFELWIILNKEKIKFSNAVALFFLMPAAIFFKSNGIILLLPISYALWKLKNSSRWILLGIVFFWTLTIQIGNRTTDLGKGHGALQPLILFETVNFMQSRPMALWENRHMVTDKTKEIIYRYISQSDIDLLYDRDYWDTLWHQNQDRVKFRQMSREDSKNLRNEFFKYNLWRNLPAFLSSRVNIFFASALAQGGMVGPDNAKHGLRNVDTLSTFSPLGIEQHTELINKIYDRSYSLRFLLWSPFFGIFLLFYSLRKAILDRKMVNFLISLTLVFQLFGIALFSIAAEYRYLLMFFYAPLLFFPLFLQNSTGRPSAKHKYPRISAAE